MTNRPEIHLWWLQLDSLSGSSLLSACGNLLPVSERKRYSRLLTPEDRARGLLGRVMLRTVLSCHAHMHPVQWRFERSASGKPRLLNPESSMYFNMAHSHNQIIVAVSESGAVGIDIEYMQPGRDPMAIARRYFSEEEYAALAKLPSFSRRERFYELWTLKEAWIKAQGKTLASTLTQAKFAQAKDGNYRPVPSGGCHVPDTGCYATIKHLKDYRAAAVQLPSKREDQQAITVRHHHLSHRLVRNLWLNRGIEH